MMRASTATLPIPARELPDPFGPAIPLRAETPVDVLPVSVDSGPDIGPPAPAPAATGRPSAYTRELAGMVIEELRLGRTPSEVASEPWAPGLATIYRWMDRSPEFRESVSRARAQGAAVMADRALVIADNADDTTKGGVQKARLQVDARFRLAAVYDRRFSDRQIVTHEHTEPGQSLDMQGQDIAALAAQLGKLLAKAQAVDVESEPVETKQVADKTGE